jgi:hypothetical protein
MYLEVLKSPEPESYQNGTPLNLTEIMFEIIRIHLNTIRNRETVDYI